MGRFGSIADLFQGLVQITLTLILGLFAEWFSLQIICFIFSLISTLFAAFLVITLHLPNKTKFFYKDATVDNDIQSNKE